MAEGEENVLVVEVDESQLPDRRQSSYKVRGMGSVPHKCIERDLPERINGRSIEDATIEDVVGFLKSQQTESETEGAVMRSINSAMSQRNGVSYMCVAYLNGDINQPETITAEHLADKRAADYMGQDGMLRIHVVDDARGGI